MTLPGVMGAGESRIAVKRGRTRAARLGETANRYVRRSAYLVFPSDFTEKPKALEVFQSMIVKLRRLRGRSSLEPCCYKVFYPSPSIIVSVPAMRASKTGLLAILTLIVATGAATLVHGIGGDYRFVMYGFTWCPHCQNLHRIITENFGGDKLVAYYMDKDSSGALLRNYEYLYQKLYGMVLGTPLTFVVKDGRIIAAVAGEAPAGFWMQVLARVPPENTIYVYISGREGYQEVQLTPEEYRYVESLVLSPTGVGGGATEPSGPPPVTQSLAGLALLIAGLAAVDSINPCVFALMASMTAAGSLKDRGSGFAVIFGILVGYALLGVAFSAFSSYVGSYTAKMVAGFAALAVILYKNLGTEPCVEGQAVSKGLVSWFLLGLTLSWTVLPCSGGPYFVALGVMAETALLLKMALLAFYLAIFVAPLVVIVVGLRKAVPRRHAEKLGRVGDFIVVVLAFLLIFGLI